VDLETNDLWQHLPLDMAAYTMKGGDHSPNSDSGVNIQIEVIGYTAGCPLWPDAHYARLLALLEWISVNVGVPLEYPMLFVGPNGVAPRASWEQWEPLSGVLGHCHAPYNDHHDPTGLDVSRLQPGESPPPPPTGDFVTREEFDRWRDELRAAI
jgi:hypothetical protein